MVLQADDNSWEKAECSLETATDEIGVLQPGQEIELPKCAAYSVGCDMIEGEVARVDIDEEGMVLLQDYLSGQTYPFIASDIRGEVLISSVPSRQPICVITVGNERVLIKNVQSAGRAYITKSQEIAPEDTRAEKQDLSTQDSDVLKDKKSLSGFVREILDETSISDLTGPGETPTLMESNTVITAEDQVEPELPYAGLFLNADSLAVIVQEVEQEQPTEDGVPGDVKQMLEELKLLGNGRTDFVPGPHELSLAEFYDKFHFAPPVGSPWWNCIDLSYHFGVTGAATQAVAAGELTPASMSFDEFREKFGFQPVVNSVWWQFINVDSDDRDVPRSIILPEEPENFWDPWGDVGDLCLMKEDIPGLLQEVQEPEEMIEFVENSNTKATPLGNVFSKLALGEGNLARVFLQTGRLLGIISREGGKVRFITYDGETYEINEGNPTLVIGRDKVRNISVSRQHFTISLYNGEIFIKDGSPDGKTSGNGSWLDTIELNGNLIGEDDKGLRKRLFPKGKIEETRMEQKNIGDCTLLSAFTGLVNHPYGAELLEPLFKHQGQGKWIITFPHYPFSPIEVNENEVTESRLTRFRQSVFGQEGKKPVVTNSLAIKLLERAYGRLIKQYRSDYDSTQMERDPVSSDDGEGLGTLMALDLKMGRKIKGDTHLQVLLGDKIEKKIDLHVHHNEEFVGTGVKSALELLQKCKENPGKYILTAGATNFSNAEEAIYLDPEKRFISKHAYAIGKVGEDTVEIINPWDTKNRRHVISIDEFLSYFYSIRGVELTDNCLEELETPYLHFVKKNFREVGKLPS